MLSCSIKCNQSLFCRYKKINKFKVFIIIFRYFTWDAYPYSIIAYIYHVCLFELSKKIFDIFIWVLVILLDIKGGVVVTPGVDGLVDDMSLEYPSPSSFFGLPPPLNFKKKLWLLLWLWREGVEGAPHPSSSPPPFFC